MPKCRLCNDRTMTYTMLIGLRKIPKLVPLCAKHSKGFEDFKKGSKR